MGGPRDRRPHGEVVQTVDGLSAVVPKVHRRWRSNSVVVLEQHGERYLVTAYGDSEWSRNCARQDADASPHARTEDFTAVEVPAKLPQLIEAYLQQFGKLPTVDDFPSFSLFFFFFFFFFFWPSSTVGSFPNCWR